MKLTIKVVIAFAILCGLMALGGAFSYFNMSRIDAAFSLVVKDIARLREDGNAIGQGLLRISKMSNDMVFANNKKELEQARDSFVSESRGLDQKIDDLSGALQTLGSAGNSSTIAAELKKSVSTVFQDGQRLYQIRQEILDETAKIDRIKTDFLNKLSFARVAVDSSFQAQRQDDPYIDSLAKQIYTQLGTMEYMVNAIFSAQSLEEMKRIQQNAVSMSGMILNAANVLEQELVAAKENSDFAQGIAALRENDGVKNGAIARYVALQGKRAQLLEQVQLLSEHVNQGLQQEQQLSHDVKTIGDRAFENATTSISTTTLSIMLSLLLSLFFAAIVGWRLSVSIKGPMEALQRILRQLAAGNFTQRVEGRFSGEFAELQRDINAVIREFNQALTVVKSGAEQTRLTANKNRESADVLASQVQVQSSTMTTLAATITEMEHAIQDVNSNTQSSLDMVLSVDQQVQSGRQLVGENNHLVSTLFENLKHSEGVIQQVSAQSEHIGGILEVIAGISEQTNLLALNAAIEAARAGEHGRGFAVVADEVRNLASRTNQSTQEINAMITELQQKSSGAVASMRESLSMMVQGKDKMNQVNEAIGMIADHMLNVRNAAELIANATREQTVASREISRSINEMSDVIEQSSRTMNDMASQSNALDRLCEQQEQTVQQFKLGQVG
ncbi:methyl-accepting chemotaxis protein [Pseudaeromonas sharmana]|uniref:Methyl-accepting chemotaxis protein n=1 Tax=Pseudaeromonas sharmana TaxID=328412 RepID=A0ABV8CPI3_9GAMM